MRGRSNGKRHLHRLAIGIGRACIGRDVLVIDIHLTLDEPIVGRHGTTAVTFYFSQIFASLVVAVIDNSLRAVNKVAGRLPFHFVTIRGKIIPDFIGNSTSVQFGQGSHRL